MVASSLNSLVQTCLVDVSIGKVITGGGASRIYSSILGSVCVCWWGGGEQGQSDTLRGWVGGGDVEVTYWWIKEYVCVCSWRR